MKNTLDKLNLNTIGIVDSIECSDNIKNRLLDLGIIKGTQIIPIFRSVFNNPTAYKVRGSVLAIRDEDAKSIKLLNS